MAAVDQERPNDRSTIINKAGRLNKELFCANADFRNGIEVGIRIWVMKWQVEEMFPELPGIFQSALNAKQHVGSGELTKHKSIIGEHLCFLYIGFR